MQYVWQTPGDPAQGYQGQVAKTLKESKPWWRPPHQAPQGAPNVVVILLDDLGFSDFGCFGSEIATPHIDALAGQGLRFTGYTTVPMCTPARAAMLTGKNPHAVGCGWLTHNNPGYPGYQAGEITSDAPTMPELLRGLGYGTYGVGKWHNTADYHIGAGKDRSSWPLQRGFDRFYGFMGAETHFFSPNHLIEGNELVSRDAYEPGYYSTRDWTDRAIGYLRAHRGSAPDKPFFLYLAHNAPHVPLHAPAEAIAHYDGVYDSGWDRMRELRFERQRLMGLIGQDWRLSQSNPGVPRWDEVPPEQRPLMAHYMQVYAAMVEVVDQQVGRLVAELKALGVFDNTLILLTSDNGANSIGGPEGAVNMQEKRMAMGNPADMAKAALQAHADGTLGDANSYPAYPVGWANCSNTPFRFYKRTPMNGGIRVPMVMSFPARVQDPGALRRQWIHVTDTLPTLLDLLGAQYPDHFKGQATRGMDGASYLPLFSDPQAPAARTRQAYELEGNRGMIVHPWKIVSLQAVGGKLKLDNWLLFNLDDDPTECDNLAEQHPDVLLALISEFDEDAARNHIYPLDNRDLRKVLAVPPFLEAQYSAVHHFYPGVETVPTQSFSPLIADRDYRIDVSFAWEADQEGVLLAIGDKAAGLCLFVQESHVVLAYSFGRGNERQCRIALTPGAQALTLEHTAPGGMRGQGLLSLNGVPAQEPLNMSPTFLRLGGEGLDVGLDRRRKVSAACEGRGVYAYSGRIDCVTLTPGAQAPGSFANRPEALAQWD